MACQRAMIEQLYSLPADPEVSGQMEAQVRTMMENTIDQFPGILLAAPSIEGIFTTSTGKRYLRVKFRIWPGRGGPLETIFRQELIKSMQALDPSFTDWMVSIFYETEKPKAIPRRKRVKGR